MLTEYSLTADKRLQIQFTIFAKSKNNFFEQYKSIVLERSYPTKQILNELRKSFSKVEIIDPDRKNPNAESCMLYFVCRS